MANALDVIHELRKKLDATENPDPKQLAELLSVVAKQLVHLSECLEGTSLVRSGKPKHRQ